MVRVVLAAALTAAVAPAPAAQLDCAEFKSPLKLAAGSEFRSRLPKGLELRLSKDWQISVRPVGEDTNYLWLVSPPLRTAPQRMLGKGYGVSAIESAKIKRSLRFVLNREDYYAALASHELPDAAQTLKRLDELGRGVLVLYVDKYELDGDNFRWISFHGKVACPGSPVLTAEFSSRLATLDDLPQLRELIHVSIRDLVSQFLDPARVDASFEIMGLDTQLIEDGTYFVVEAGDRIAGCGGWSRRATLYGPDQLSGRDARLLDPRSEPARIRAMYTHPDFARRGVGRLVLSLCEAAAKREGFRALEMMATAPGEPLYLVSGYSVIERVEIPTSKGVGVPCAVMRKGI